MRSAVVRYLLCLALSACGPPMGSQSINPGSPRTYSFDLDTPEGHFSEWTIDDLGSATHVDAHLTVGALRHNSEWMPAFTVLLGDSAEAVLFRVSSPEKNQPLVAGIAHLLPGVSPEGYEFDSPPALGDTAVLSLDWARPGHLVADFRGQQFRFRTSRPLTRLMFASSSGQMKAARIAICQDDEERAKC